MKVRHFAILLALLGLFVADSSRRAAAGVVDVADLMGRVIVRNANGREPLSLDIDSLSSITENSDGSTTFEGNFENPEFELTWDFTGNPDPIVVGSIGFVNNTALPKLFTVTLLQPVSPALGSSLTGGSVGGSVTDGNFNGSATLSTQAGKPLYTALIDGAPFQTLINDPFSITANFGGTTTFGPAQFGAPVPSLPGPAVTSDIAVTLNFLLSPGDLASITFNFTVVPEPATWLLCATGMVGLVMVARRRR